MSSSPVPGISLKEQEGFYSDVVRPFSAWVEKNKQERSSELPVIEHDRQRICYLAMFCTVGGGNALGPVALAILETLTRQLPERYELYLYAWMVHSDPFIDQVRELGVTVRTFDLTVYSMSELEKLTRREYALIFTAVGASLLALIPLLLYWLGTRWQPGVRSLDRSVQPDSGKRTMEDQEPLARAGASAR